MSDGLATYLPLCHRNEKNLQRCQEVMKEEKKVGYSALIVGAISLGEAWINT